jgi:hypothetical protein
MADWSVKIIPDANGVPAAIVPDLHGSKPGDPLQVQEDDLISWNNTTDKPCQPWPTDWKYQPVPGAQGLSDQIPAGKSSRPLYDVPLPASGNIIYYYLKEYPNVRGTIVVSPMPTALNVPPP